MLRVAVASLAASVLASAVVTAAPKPAEAAVRDCAGFKLFAHVYDFSVRDMSCRRATRLIRGSSSPTGRLHWRAARRAGFRCGRIGDVYEGAVYRCANGGRAFRFTYGF